MKQTRTLFNSRSVAVVAFGCCLILGLPALSAQAKRKAVPSSGSGAKQAKSGEEVDLSELGSFRSQMRGVIERYGADRGSLSRLYAIESSSFGSDRRGLNRPSALMLSSTGRARLKEFYTHWLARLEQLDFDSMSQDDRLDYLLLKNHLTYESRQTDIEAKALAETAPLIPFAQAIADLEDARRRMELMEPAKSAVFLNNLNKQIEETRKTVEAGLKSDAKTEGKSDAAKIKKTTANRAALIVGSLRNVLRNWFNFYNGYDPVFTWWAAEPYKAADKALENYAAFLRGRVAGVQPTDENAIIGDPIGRDALLSELAHEMIPYTPEELIALANQEFVWCETELKRASRDLGDGDDWHKALEYVKTLYVEPGKQPELIRKLGLEAMAFVDQHDLVTVPPLAREDWWLEMMSPERQLVNPFFTGGEIISVSYPTNTMSHEQKMMSMRGNNIPFSRATVFHEMIPGHHLQGFMSARYRPYRRLFSTPFWGEGYSLYWEMLFWDLNFPKSPEDRIGMLFWRMHRCSRIIFSLSFHLGKMTPEECIDLLVNRGGHERDNATAEVRRSLNGSVGPLYQCAYMLGGLQIRALHHELVDSGKMTNRAFHDAVFKENSIPIEMIRASLTKQKLTRDFTSNWKFYGPDPAGAAASSSKH